MNVTMKMMIIKFTVYNTINLVSVLYVFVHFITRSYITAIQQLSSFCTLGLCMIGNLSLMLNHYGTSGEVQSTCYSQ